MARARTIKPQFLRSHSMAQVSLGARLAFVQLWLIADDAGRVFDHPVSLPRQLFPNDRSAQPLVMGWMDELARQHCIERYEVDRSGYLRIVNWRRYQRISHATPSRLPPRPVSREPSGAIREPLASDAQEANGGAELQPIPESSEQFASPREPLGKNADKPRHGSLLGKFQERFARLYTNSADGCAVSAPSPAGAPRGRRH